MKILLTGATGYIAQRLLPVLLDQGHEVVCCVRDVRRFNTEAYQDKNISVVEADLVKKDTLSSLPRDIDAAYYLVHSMSTQGDFGKSEERSAKNFVEYIATGSATQIIYLSGIVNERELSAHLSSRKNVESILGQATAKLTTLRAAIIVGSGSASFEIIRDLVEKLPVMVAPKWLYTKCQPIAIRNVVQFLSGVLAKESTFGKHFDIYGPAILTYKEMLLGFAEVRGLKRTIVTVPVMTPRLSSYWLYFVTSTSYTLAKNLVDSMKIDVIATPNDLAGSIGIQLIDYKTAIGMAFDKIEQNLVLSSWSGAMHDKGSEFDFDKLVKVPRFGCFKDRKTRKIIDAASAVDRILAIGGDSGWYYANWLWEFRGFLDKLFGGVGLNRGRKNRNVLDAGDVLDFWRVVYVNKDEGRLLLYAEMKLPGEAWLEFKVSGDRSELVQTATFRPLGLAGRLYWYAVLPFHYFIFNGMIRRITKGL
ncbi:SDR family oxidoreductase [Flavobacterium sp. MAH-1]|uniref:SDR family oxidoreductase n=1 Tax=Flavobacterium agri TaxID=2743471 RepID=A0A7Y9C7Z9_9FLAO|nr:SDR family oxidoreductase [Flavobacterium agri]NUY81934.1 SDR family oxidoreductase [Flavobacterium agri]NYA71958.1 SDR family oxidoreductase [Flavobacterium agri]